MHPAYTHTIPPPCHTQGAPPSCASPLSHRAHAVTCTTEQRRAGEVHNFRFGSVGECEVWRRLVKDMSDEHKAAKVGGKRVGAGGASGLGARGRSVVFVDRGEAGVCERPRDKGGTWGGVKEGELIGRTEGEGS